MSEVLGYVLLFSFITLSVTSVFVLGTTHVEHVRDTDQKEHAAQAFETLADAIDDHFEQHAAVRSTELRTDGGELSFETEETVHLEVVPTSDVERNRSPAVVVPSYSTNHTTSVVYTSTSGSTVVYSHGAVFREESGHSRMIREPTAQFGDERVVFPVVATTSDGPIATSNAHISQVRTERLSSETVSETESGYDLRITLQTTEARAEAWHTYFETRNGLACEAVEGHTIACTASDLEAVTLAYVVVETSFE